VAIRTGTKMLIREANRHFFPLPQNKDCHSERSEESPVTMKKQFD